MAKRENFFLWKVIFPMETPEKIERQIWAQVHKFNEVSRQLKAFEKTPAYKD